MEDKKVELDPFCMSDCTNRINRALTALYRAKSHFVPPFYAAQGTDYSVGNAIDEAIRELLGEDSEG